MILGDQEAVHFTRQGVEVVQFFPKNKANFVNTIDYPTIPYPTREKATRGVSPFLAWGDFHARLRFARSTILEEKWGTTRSL